MFDKGDWVKLKGKTRHGKNRINQHGNHWLVTHVGKFNGQPAVMLRSMKQTDRGQIDRQRKIRRKGQKHQKHRDRHREQQTNRQAETEIETYGDRQTDKQTNRQTEERTDIRTQARNE